MPIDMSMPTRPPLLLSSPLLSSPFPIHTHTHSVIDLVLAFDRSNIYELIRGRGKAIDRKSALRNDFINGCHIVILNDAKMKVFNAMGWDV